MFNTALAASLATLRPAMAVLLNAMTVADAPNLYREPVAHLHVTFLLTLPHCGTSTFDKPHVRHQAGAVVLI